MKRYGIVLFLILLTLLVIPGTAWLSGYVYRQEFTITGSANWSGDLTDHPIMITCQYESGSSSGNTLYLNDNAQSDFDDVRFTTSADSLCDIWQESKTDDDVAVFWVEIPTISTTTTTGYCYYGNASVSTTSNGTLVFDFFDDFNDASLDTAKWDQISGTSAEESGLLKVEVTAGGAEEVKTDTAFGNNTWVRSRLKAKDIGASTTAGNSTYLSLQNTDDGNKGHIAMYAATSANGYDYYNVGAATEYDDIVGVSADTYFIQDVLRHHNHTDYYVDNTNLVTQSTNYYTGNTKVRSRVNHNTGSEYVYLDWVFVFDGLAPVDLPTISSWDSEELDPTYALTADFSSNVTTGDAPLDVGFVDDTVGTPTKWFWDLDGDSDWDMFGDDPPFTYYGGLVPGYTIAYPDEIDSGYYYNVSLKVENAYTSDWENKSAYMAVGVPDIWLSTPTIGANVTSGDVPLTVSFTGGGNNTPTAWAWDIDGDSASPYNVSGDFEYATQNATHTYNVAGIYTVRLKVTNAGGYAVGTETNYITANEPGVPPVADFSANDTTPLEGQDVLLTDLSTNTPTSWAWSFDDGGPNSTDQNATHAWTTAGTYTVILTATNDEGSDTETKVDYIVVSAPGAAPVANFAANDTTPTINQTVLFTDSSTNTPTGWAWSWDDGTANSTTQNPTHNWSAAGTYTVTLTATNAEGSDTEVKVNYITVSAPTPTPTPTPTSSGSYYPRIAAVGTIAPVSTQAYNALRESFNTTNGTAGFNFTGMGEALAMPFTDQMGGLFYAILLAIPFIVAWIATGKTWMPLVGGIVIMGFSITAGWIPAEYTMPIMIFIVLAVTGIVWLLLRDRQ